MHLDSRLTSADLELVAACAETLDAPKQEPPDSFILHAPLEFLARAIMLERVPEDRRELARDRLRWLAETYQAAGPEAGVDLEAIGARERPLLPRDFVDTVVPALSAAGHGPILLNLRPRVAGIDPSFGSRALAIELARYPDWTLSWHRSRTRSGAGSGNLVERLAAPRSPGDPGSDFIYPTMHVTDASGLAAEVLDAPLRDLDVATARVQLLRVAARSMLQDDPARAPYGWTHCLTMPQAVLAIAEDGTDPGDAVAVAATYVLGFRSTLGTVRLDPEWAPAAPGALDNTAALAGSPGDAAALLWWAEADALPHLVDELVAYAAIHRDAHLAKYTLACIDATDADPGAGRLYLAAAAFLGAWWRALPMPDDPILGALASANPPSRSRPISASPVRRPSAAGSIMMG